jgi:NTP pyrophosphatase (non-canonical NTP hydrolase)
MPSTTATKKSNNTNRKTVANPAKKVVTMADIKQPYHATPFGEYFRVLDEIDKGKKYTKEYGSVMIISLLEELGEMARAYLAEHGRKRTNLAAQEDETYQQELGDLLVTILRFARIKNINLHDRIMYTLNKIQARQTKPKAAKKR